MSLISDIRSAIVKDRPFTIKKGRVNPLNVFTRLRHMRDSQYHKERIGQIAQVLACFLRQSPRLTIQQTTNDLTIQTVRAFLKKVSAKYHDDPRIKNCRKQLVAARLAIDPKFVSSDFQKFAIETHLDRYLLQFGHRLIPNCLDFEILVNGEYKAWKEARKKIKPSPKISHRPQQIWKYGQNGIQNKDMYDWSKLKPFKKGNPNDWGNQYIFEFCACCSRNGSVRLQGDHAWFRLKTPEGDIYSIGLYRLGKRGKLDHVCFPFRVKPGHLMQPDVSEFWPIPIFTIPVAITKEQFEAIKQSVEEDKKNEGTKFQLFDNNCTQYTKRKAALAGINIPTSIHIIRYITPKCILKVTDKLPKLIRKVISVVATPFLNLILFFLGSGKVDKSLKNKRITIKPHSSSFADLFKQTKLQFHPPLYLAHHTRPLIENWRKKKLEKYQDEKRRLIKRKDPSLKNRLEQIEKKIKRIPYALPKKL